MVRELRFVPQGHPAGYEYGKEVSSWSGEYSASAGDELPSCSGVEANGTADVGSQYPQPSGSFDEVAVVSRFLPEYLVPDGVLTGNL